MKCYEFQFFKDEENGVDVMKDENGDVNDNFVEYWYDFLSLLLLHFYLLYLIYDNRTDQLTQDAPLHHTRNEQ